VTRSDVRVAVLDPLEGGRTHPAVTDLQRVTELLGRGAVVGLTSVYVWSPQDRLAVEDLGVRLLTVGVDDDPASVRRTLAAAAASAFLLRDVSRCMADRLEPEALALALAALDPSDANRGVGATWRRLNVSERELRRRAARMGLPAPRELRRWARVLLALGLHRIGVTSGAALATLLGYEDPASLCRLFRGVLDRTPGDVLGADAEEARMKHRLAAVLSGER
jgi:AraC-like DNA-binding protein